jgi:hypothetical protein
VKEKTLDTSVYVCKGIRNAVYVCITTRRSIRLYAGRVSSQHGRDAGETVGATGARKPPGPLAVSPLFLGRLF